jgi:hypothetical protein
MASPRTRRLMLDYELLQKRFANWPPIQITGKAGLPPEAYRFTYALKGIYVGEGGEILERACARGEPVSGVSSETASLPHVDTCISSQF